MTAPQSPVGPHRPVPAPGGPAGAALQAVRGSQDRDYAAEGIPMLLALVSEVEPIPDPVEAVRLDGRGLAEAVEQDRQAVAPTRRDADLGITGSLLQARAFRDLAGGTDTGAGPA
ncbi:hypothetical protein [Nakamurella endophytica]|uniref:Uncharacterized protein n=1 Tax=Nakamurella endophytica TaxID=1748367 RepID=A0A917T3N5_9ACTN|nr:hypothetical protein [Nakamurella endophytica]GGM07137.1 hypothetical protein GCM10011594_28940 [Nakamurella endophytica]